jgi:hypothetical protein
MKIQTLAILAAGLVIGSLVPVATFAEDAAKPTPMQIAQDRSRAEVANALVIMGRADKDPDMLMMAARLLAEVSGDVADPKASTADKPVFYDIGKLVDEAKTYPAKRSELPPKKEMNSGFCHYEYLCDSLSCAYEWVC